MLSVSVTPLEAQHVEQALDVYVDSWSQSWARLARQVGRDRSYTRKMARRCLESGELYGGWLADELVGVSWIHPAQGKIEWIYVRPQVQQQGVGAALLEHAVDLIQQAGGQPYLYVWQDNLGALRFYERQGWVWRGGEVSDPIYGPLGTVPMRCLKLVPC